MKRENRICRKKKGFHRQLALLMTAVLIMSESNLTVLATEENAGEKLCVCESKCSADAVNVDCLVCAENYVNCVCQESAVPEEGGAGALDNGSVGDVPGEDTPAEDIPVEGGGEGTAGGEDTGDNGNGESGDIGTDDAESLEQQDVLMDGDAAAQAAAVADDGVVAYAVGDEFEDSDGIKYRVIGDGQVEVAGHRDGDAVSGGLVIPETVTDRGGSYRVTGIGERAFRLCKNLNSIKIPNSVISIGEQAFLGCWSLISIEIPNSVTKIEDRAFDSCGLISIEIPNSVMRIGDYAFSYCSNLGSIKITDSVTSIGDWAFSNCNNLRSIEIPNNITSIGEAVFWRCSSLSSIEIPSSVTHIGKSAFEGCSSLSNIEIPSSVTHIGDNAFRGCSSLNSIEIPSSVTHIGGGAFQGCSSLSSIEIPNSITKIEYGVFGECSSLSSIEIPNSVTVISMAAFAGCSSLSNIEIPNSVTSIGQAAFRFCSNLSNIKIPYGVTYIRDVTFEGCSSLSSVGIPNSVNRMNGYPFKDCSNLTALQIFVSSNGTVAPPWVSYASGFNNIPADRSLVFLAEDGTELTGDALKAAQDAYRADASDGDDTDNYWYGWKISDAPASVAYQITYHLDGYTPSQEDSQYTYGTEKQLPTPVKDGFDFDGWYGNADYSGDKITAIGSGETGDKEYYGRWTPKPAATYRVNLKVQKDGTEWTDHGRTFMLLEKGSNSMTADFETVNVGEYFVYDVTGVSNDALLTAGVNTGVSVSIVDKDVDVTVDYYTVTFYDGTAAYGADTKQSPQIILKGERAARPAEDPSKDRYRFRQWTTTDNGSEAFNFNLPITQKSNVYADWISEAATEHIIASSADEGGSISPAGNVRVPDGGEQTFEITPDDGYRIKTVMVDNQDKTDELTGGAAARAVQAQAEASRYYTFYDVREDHTIRVTFETESGGNTGGNGGESGGNTGGNGGESGSGTGGDGGNSGESGGNAGSSGGNSGESGGTTGGDSGNSGESGGTTGGSSGNNGESDNNGNNESVGNSNNTGTNGNIAINADNPNTDESSISRSSNSNKNNNTSNQSAASKDTEPKTGDTSTVEIYATVAMIAGLAYLMLYFADKERGMTEDEKQEIIMALIRWAKRGSRIRRYVVLIPIFVLLFYYHSIGKRVYVEWEESLV